MLLVPYFGGILAYKTERSHSETKAREQGEIKFVLGLKPTFLDFARTGSVVLPSEDTRIWLQTSILCLLFMSQSKTGKTVAMPKGWHERERPLQRLSLLSCPGVTIVFAVSRSLPPRGQGPCLTVHSGNHCINAYESKFEVILAPSLW